MTTNEKYKLDRKIRYRAVETDGVLVHMDTGRVIVINEVGLKIVESMKESAKTKREITETIVKDFDVNFEQAERDVLVFFEEMVAENIISITSNGET